MRKKEPLSIRATEEILTKLTMVIDMELFLLLLMILGIHQSTSTVSLDTRDLPVSGHLYEDWEVSSLETFPGHYPLPYCSITNVILNGTNGLFQYKNNHDLHSKACELVSKVWELKNKARLNSVRCREFYDIGYVYTIFYWYGGSNYYHLHWDTLFPLYQEMYYRKTVSESSCVVLMPSVESSRLQRINWETDAFENPDKYWVYIARFLAREKDDFKPLDKKLLMARENICFKEVKFGTPQVNYGNSDFVRSFIQHVKSQFGINEAAAGEEKVGIISRSNRRLILNEQELVEALQPFVKTELVVFDGMSFQQQVETMQQYTVLAGMNGAGLMNCIYLPTNSVCVQMVPYKAHLNFAQYSDLLKARGPYMEWHNTHQNLNRPARGDNHQNRPNTFVHVEEFVALIKEALQKSRLAHRDEL